MFELLEKGRSKVEVAEIQVLGVKRNTIYRWLKVGNTSLPERDIGLAERD